MNTLNWIQSEREKRKISQAKLARLTGLSPYRISDWERGNTSPSEAEATTLTQFFNSIDEKIKIDDSFLKKKKFERKYNEKKVSKLSIKSEEISSKSSYVRNSNGLKVIDLFSGIGGLTLGYERAGFKVLGHVEIEKPLREIYEANFPDSVNLGNDIRAITNEEIAGWTTKLGKIDVLIGGPPCQGFSLAGKRNVYDPRNQLYLDFARIAKILKPKAVMLENVRTLLSMTAPDGSYIKDHIVSVFDDAGYDCQYMELNAQDYGVPQSRGRVFFIGLRKDIAKPIKFPEPTHGAVLKEDIFGTKILPYKTFRDATNDLERLESGMSSDKDPWHFAISHPEHVIDMLRDVPQGQSAHDNPDPNKRPSSGFNTTYKRLTWDEPSSTISTNFSMISGSRNVHPQDTRSLTIREAMRCQTFPDDFTLIGKLGDIRKGIGNAVPCGLAEALAKQIYKLINSDS